MLHAPRPHFSHNDTKSTSFTSGRRVWSPHVSQDLASLPRWPLQIRFEDDWSQSGDVKYHLGMNSVQQIGDNEVHLTLLPNPSHLEAVNTLVLGKSA